MKRIFGTIKGRGNKEERPNVLKNGTTLPTGDSPQAVIVREVTAFCESGAPDSNSAGDEYLHLPAIVDAAESSPAAATEAANCIRKYLGKENYNRGYAQYNAIMLTRILTDNPARAFTRNFDNKFIATTKELLRDGKDMSVQQILRETLDYFEMEKLRNNDTLMQLVEMWRKEKSKKYGNTAGPRTLRAPPFDPNQQQQPGANYYARQNHRPRGLPPPDELAARIEEAKTTARLLLQTIQSTPISELMGNELVKEFADRATAAQRSIQGYMNSENPHPDEDTMLTLIETSDQLNIASSKYQRALLQARKTISSAAVPPPPIQPGENIYSPVPQSQVVTPHFTQNFTRQQQQQEAEEQYVSPIHQPSPHDYLGPQSEQSGSLYVPPTGPPPSAIESSRTQDYGPIPPLPNRTRPVSSNLSQDTQSAQYGVADNPFADPTTQSQVPQQPQQSGYSLFSSAARNLQGQNEPPQSDYHTNFQNSPYANPNPVQGRGPLYGGFQTTPSYIQRQESSFNNLTMHGASPPHPEAENNITSDGDGSILNRRRGDM